VLTLHMQWGLFVLAMLFVAVLQFAVWRRLQRGDVGITDQPAPSDHSHPSEAAAQEASDPDVRLCPQCGTENDVGYDFCRECVASLGV
jgi:hypothetical protein